MREDSGGEGVENAKEGREHGGRGLFALWEPCVELAGSARDQGSDLVATRAEEVDGVRG